jgi:hypothetical protein
MFDICKRHEAAAPKLITDKTPDLSQPVGNDAAESLIHGGMNFTAKSVETLLAQASTNGRGRQPRSECGLFRQLIPPRLSTLVLPPRPHGFAVLLFQRHRFECPARTGALEGRASRVVQQWH